MPETKQQNERLIAVLIAGLLALNYPLLSLFSKVRLVFGVPLLYLYLFAVWYIIIACVALILAKPVHGPPTNHPSGTEKSE